MESLSLVPRPIFQMGMGMRSHYKTKSWKMKFNTACEIQNMKNQKMLGVVLNLAISYISGSDRFVADKSCS